MEKDFCEEKFRKINDLKYLMLITNDENERNKIINEMKTILTNVDQETKYEENRGREITLKELAKYDGSNNKPAYVAVNGTVYDLTGVKTWIDGMHMGLVAGKDLTNDFKKCHNNKAILANLRIVGFLVE